MSDGRYGEIFEALLTGFFGTDPRPVQVTDDGALKIWIAGSGEGGGGSSATSFYGLTDTPEDSYSGNDYGMVLASGENIYVRDFITANRLSGDYEVTGFTLTSPSGHTFMIGLNENHQNSPQDAFFWLSSDNDIRFGTNGQDRVRMSKRGVEIYEDGSFVGGNYPDLPYWTGYAISGNAKTRQSFTVDVDIELDSIKIITDTVMSLDSLKIFEGESFTSDVVAEAYSYSYVQENGYFSSGDSYVYTIDFDTVLSAGVYTFEYRGDASHFLAISSGNFYSGGKLYIGPPTNWSSSYDCYIEIRGFSREPVAVVNENGYIETTAQSDVISEHNNSLSKIYVTDAGELYFTYFSGAVPVTKKVTSTVV